MAFDKCGDCGCPQFKSFGPHYKGCERLTTLRIVKIDAIKYFERAVDNYKKEIGYAKRDIKEIRDCIKDVCLDEIYECRWDCMSVLREVA